MILPKPIIYWGKQVRAWLKPFPGVSLHLCQLTQDTAKDLHLTPLLVAQLTQDTQETCRQCGFTLLDDNP